MVGAECRRIDVASSVESAIPERMGPFVHGSSGRRIEIDDPSMFRSRGRRRARSYPAHDCLFDPIGADSSRVDEDWD